MQQPLPKLSDTGGVDSPHYWPVALRPETRKRRAAQERRRLRRAGHSEDVVQRDPIARYQERVKR